MSRIDTDRVQDWLCGMISGAGRAEGDRCQLDRQRRNCTWCGEAARKPGRGPADPAAWGSPRTCCRNNAGHTRCTRPCSSCRRHRSELPVDRKRSGRDCSFRSTAPGRRFPKGLRPDRSAAGNPIAGEVPPERSSVSTFSVRSSRTSPARAGSSRSNPLCPQAIIEPGGPRIKPPGVENSQPSLLASLEGISRTTAATGGIATRGTGQVAQDSGRSANAAHRYSSFTAPHDVPLTATSPSCRSRR